MNIIFRVDSSLRMGTGHVMRCITLAKALRQKKNNVEFITRDLCANISPKITEEGFTIHLLPPPSESTNCLSHNSSEWLGVTWQLDSEQTISILEQKDQRVDLLIVDHYAIDAKWERTIRPKVHKVIVIDDLANRKHHCDILLDQTFGRKQEEYAKLIPKSCKLLCGASYTLLRPDFFHFRRLALKKRKKFTKLKSILISMGGVDAPDISGKLLSFFEATDKFNNVKITFILNKKAPHYQKLKKNIDKSEHNIVLLSDVTNIAEILYYSDLAFGACGTSNWERCCLGLPSAVTVIADNQKKIASEMVNMQAAIFFDTHDFKHEYLNKILNRLTDISNYQMLSRNAFNICDGLGVGRLLQHILEEYSSNCELISLRDATYADCGQIYEWQKHPETRKFARNANVPMWEEHQNWFKKQILDPTSHIFILEADKKPVGSLRLNFVENNLYEISIFIDPEHFGQGLGSASLKLLRLLFPTIEIEAFVMPENIASQRLFEKAGYLRIKKNLFISKPKQMSSVR